MGKEFYDLTCEELCELMCGKPEEDEDGRKGDTAVDNSERTPRTTVCG